MIFSELPTTATREGTNSTWAYMALRATDDGGNPYHSVTVLEFRGLRRTRRVVDRYTMERVSPEAGLATAAVMCGKTHHSGDEDTVRGRDSLRRVGEVYKCEVGPKFAKCSCTAGSTELARQQFGPTANCVHLLVLKDLVAQGEFDEPIHAGHDDRTGAVDGGHGTEPPDDWWAEAAGGRLATEPLGV
jgi:hypothetical protein